MEKARVWAILFRISTESSIMIKTPFDAKTFNGDNIDDQLDAGAYCLGRMGGAWIPALFAVATPADAEKIRDKFLESITEDKDGQP
jgi:hypothetical protein